MVKGKSGRKKGFVEIPEDEEKKGGNREEMSRLYGESLKDIAEGHVAKGRIIAITGRDVLVDVGYKSEGVIPLTEFDNPSSLKVGDEIDVLVETKEDEEGMIILSKRKAERMQSWERIVQNCNEGDVVEGRIIKRIKGGYMVDVGIEGFLPASQLSFRTAAGPAHFSNQPMKFKIIKLNKARKNIILSHKEFLQMEKEVSKTKLLSGLEKGQLRTGIVKNITDFGAFIDLGGVDGLLHVTDMSWSRVSHPSELLAVGDKIEVMVLGFDKESMKISLGLKQKTASPWEGIETKYPVGTRIKGKVVNLMSYGAFVELESGVEGLVHISEFSWTKRVGHPSEMLAIGDVIEAVVLGVNKEEQKISLGIKQTEANPWLEIGSKYPAGTIIKGKVRNLTDYGAFVELEEDIDGMVHISDLSWTRKINHPSEILKKGQKVEAIVLSVDGENHKISLGVKQLIPDPWSEITKKFLVGSIVDGKITKVTNFGLFVELEKDVEGLVHSSEIILQPDAKVEDQYKEETQIRVRVIKIDNEQRRIGLSMKDLPPSA
ncbi:MAG: 30S ribosomal protein S1 [Candidatus Omnitrophica bacterium]|nr:30S ribosomal protein S1 [Candidatus Omnitrophota bacterium]